MNTQYHAWQDIFLSMVDDQGKVLEKIVADLDKELLPLLNVILPVQLEESPKLRQMSGI